jgi:Uma2 family endonuclease
MSATLQQPWTIERFLAWEERQGPRFEFDGLRPVVLTGGTAEDDAIRVNLLRALGNRLQGKPCRGHGDSLKIRLTDSIRDPDAFMTCTPVRPGSTVATEPVAIFAVLRSGTARTDRRVKNREYAGTASVRRHVILGQTAPDGMAFVRRDGGDWVGHLLRPEVALHMPEIGVELPLAEIYADIEFADAIDDAAR